MIKKTCIAFIIVLLFSHSLFAASQTATVRTVSGKVEYRTSGAAWSAASQGMEIPLGAVISTGFNSSAVLEIGTAVLEVKALTRMRLDQLAEQDGVVSTDLFLQVGRVKAEVRAVEGIQNNFTLKSPVTTASVRGTGFSFDGVNINVDNGRVVMTNRFNQTQTYRGGESGSSPGALPPVGGVQGRETGIVVSADASDVLGGTDDSGAAPPSAPKSPGPGFGTIKLDWTYDESGGGV